MNPLRFQSVSSTTLGKTTLLLSLSLLSLGLLSMSACSSSSSSTPPAPSYTLSAAALNPASITAGGTSSSAITVTAASGYSGSVHLSCASIAGSAPPACSFSTNPVTVASSVGRQFHADGDHHQHYPGRHLRYQRHRKRRQQYSSQQWSSGLESRDRSRVPAHRSDLPGEPYSRQSLPGSRAGCQRRRYRQHRQIRSVRRFRSPLLTWAPPGPIRKIMT